jgi:hypothetical protein
MGKKIALLIGVATYEKESCLPPCEADINLMTKIIEISKKYDDKLVLDESPKSIDAMAKIRSFITTHKNSEIDEVFFYYTGHGTKHSDDFLFLFSDFDGSKINSTSLANSELDNLLKSLNPKFTVKIVDACQAGVEYIKSEQNSERNLENILEKSKNRFNHTYFMFSSLENQPSTALSDYSVFTKSFADALIAYKERDICYVDIAKHIADDANVKRHQTPLFVQQSINTEIFCHVSSELAQSINDTFTALPIKINENIESNQDEKTPELRLIEAIKKQNKDYCTEQEAQSSLEKFIEHIKTYNGGEILTSLYGIDVENKSDYSNITGMSNIAKWLHGNNESYFAEVKYRSEPYQEREFNLFSNEKVTKYRNVPETIKQTADSLCHSIIISFAPKNQVTPWFKAFVVYIFSKNKLTIFYKVETEKEINWNERITLNKNTWKILHCSLKIIDEIVETSNNILNDISQYIIDDIKSKFEN